MTDSSVRLDGQNDPQSRQGHMGADEQMPHAHDHDANTKTRPSFFSSGTVFLLLAIITSGAIIGVALLNRHQTQPTAGPAPAFNLTTFDGQTVRLAELRGKVVLVNFWASWCGPCEVEAPALQNAWERYEDRGDVVFLGIAYADNGPRSLEFLLRHGVTYMNGPDTGTRISRDYNIQGVPETFIIDQNGHVAQFIYSMVTEEQLVTIIDGLLAEGAQS